MPKLVCFHLLLFYDLKKIIKYFNISISKVFMDKKKSILNVTISITSKIIFLIFSIIVRKFLIKYAGNDANGVYSLYTSIISFLAVAELGVGTAINFSMYKPIIENDTKKVSALYNLYKKIYLIAGTIIFVAGIAIFPMLPILAKDYSSNFSLHLTFFIMLVNVVLTYIYSCKTSLINAYKNNYVTTLINSLTMVLREIIQIIVLYWTGSFELYLLACIGSTLLEWLLTKIYVSTKYKTIVNSKEKVDTETKKEIIKNTKAMFMHKIGGLLVNTADSVIISSFIGVVVLGLYSNYVIIVTALQSVLSLLFTSLTSIIGHLCAVGDINEEKKYFKFMYFLNFTTGLIFYLGFYAIADNIITLCFGPYLIIDRSVVFIMTVNYFIQYLRLTVLVYRDATGTFYYDRWKPIIEGPVNVVLSILFVFWFGVAGVIIATVITNVLICDIIEPYALYKYGFKQKTIKYYILNYSLILVFVGALFVLHYCMQNFNNDWFELFVNGNIAVVIAFVPIAAMYIISPTYRQNTNKLFIKTVGLFKKRTKIVNEKNEGSNAG